MKLSTLRIQNFRSFKDETIHFSGYNCFVGPNGSGKSTVLTALNILFRESSGSADVSALRQEDFHMKQTAEPVVITATFVDLSPEAKEELRAYVRQDQLVVSAGAVWEETTQRAEILQYGARMAMEDFAPYFRANKAKAPAGDLKQIYEALQAKYPGLPKAGSGAAREEALQAYEAEHPELCTPIESPDQFYGWGGRSKLSKFCQWVGIRPRRQGRLGGAAGG